MQPADLTALIENCRSASEIEVATRPAPDGSPLPTHEYERRNTIVSLRDIAYRKLGAEWARIAEALDELARSRVAFGQLKKLAGCLDYDAEEIKPTRHSVCTAADKALYGWRESDYPSATTHTYRRDAFGGQE